MSANVDEGNVEQGREHAGDHAHDLERVVQETHALPRAPFGDQTLPPILSSTTREAADESEGKVGGGDLEHRRLQDEEAQPR